MNIGDAFTNYCSGTQPRQVSANGSIIGSFVDPHGIESGFFYPPSSALLVTLTISPGVGALPASINASGTIVGSADTHSFLRASDGTYTTFDPPGAASSGAVNINANGIVVGNFVDNGSISHAYLRNSDGTFVILDAPGAGQSPISGTYVVAINDSGTIAGWYTDANGVRHGFVRK